MSYVNMVAVAVFAKSTSTDTFPGSGHNISRNCTDELWVDSTKMLVARFESSRSERTLFRSEIYFSLTGLESKLFNAEDLPLFCLRGLNAGRFVLVMRSTLQFLFSEPKSTFDECQHGFTYVYVEDEGNVNVTSAGTLPA